MTINRIPPQATDIERTVLGSMLVSSEASSIAFQILGDESFYDSRHRKIFESMMKLWEKGVAIDILTVINKLKEQGRLEEIGEPYIAELSESMVVSGNIEYYAKILRNKAILRKIIEVTGKVYNDCFDSDAVSEDVMEVVSRQIFDMSVKNRVVGSVFTSADMMRVVTTEIGRIKSGGKVGITTGYKDIDSKVIGFCRSEITIIAGRPSMGKTALGLCMMLRQSMVHRIPVLFFSIEMSQLGLGQRAIAVDSGVGLYNIRMANYFNGNAVDESVSRISEAPFFGCDKPGITLNEIRSISMRMIKEQGIEVIYIDHTRLMGHKGKDAVERMTEISHGLKNLCKEIDRPIVPLHQISRPPKGKKIAKPVLSDLRDSGAVEEDADGVIFVHREFYYTKKDEDRDKASIIIAKQRNGPVGEITLRWKAENTSFMDYEEGEQW